MPHDPHAFIGAWTLEDWRIEYSDGRVTRPFGDAAHGYIVYAENGIMSAAIASASRRPFGVANARTAPASEKSNAFDSYFHYAGRWRVDGEDVVHDVTMALNPDMMGTAQVRRAEFDGESDLTLSALESLPGDASRRHILKWRRAGS